MRVKLLEKLLSRKLFAVLLVFANDGDLALVHLHRVLILTIPHRLQLLVYVSVCLIFSLL